MTSQPDELAPPPEPGRVDAVRHAEVALRSIGQPNSVAGEFDFWNDKYEGRRLFSELLGTFSWFWWRGAAAWSVPVSGETRSLMGRRWWPRR
jgi:hypothetical protein